MSWSTLTVLIGGVATLGIYSFLVRENAIYRFFEHLFIGIAAGLLPILTIKNLLWPKVLSPMLGYERVVFPDGFVSVPYNPLYLLSLIPMVFGLLYYFIYSVKYGWLAKLVIGFSLGFSAGLAFKGFFAEVIPQIASSFKPLVVMNESGIDIGTSISNIFFVVTLISVMCYFFFSFGSRREAEPGIISKATCVFGRWVMMICFGAFFGSTVMARMALLVERVQFLVHDWYRVLVEVLV